MLKKILASAFVCGVATVAFGQTMSLVANATATTTGADSPATFRATHFTFDLTGATGTADWTGSEISVDVVGTGSIWHASNQRISQSSPPADPNTQCYVHNLQVPALANNATNRANTLMYDTFFTAPGSAFNVDPTFASPGVPATGPDVCPANPPILSNATRIRGINPQGTQIPLAWFDTANLPLNNTVLGRLTFEVPADRAAVSDVAGPGRVLFATITGRITSATNPSGNSFSFNLYQAPEPSTMALLALGGLAGLIRRR